MNDRSSELEAVTATYADAVLAKRPDMLAALYDGESRVFDTWGAWSYETLAARRPSLDEWLGSLGDERVHVRFDDVRAGAAGDQGFLTAFVTYAAVDSAGATLRSMQNRLTWVLARRNDAWVIVHEHTSVPIGEDLQGKLKRD